jgi:hypothetical protein
MRWKVGLHWSHDNTNTQRPAVFKETINGQRGRRQAAEGKAKAQLAECCKIK